MSWSIHFTVPCVPVAQPRQRHRVVKAHGKTFAQNYTPHRHPVQDFKATVRLALERAYAGPPLAGPVGLRLVFVMPRPRSRVWKAKPMPSEWHLHKPDIDNLAKSVLDAMRTLWHDDAQVALLKVEKHVASGNDLPHVSVSVWGLEPVSEGKA